MNPALLLSGEKEWYRCPKTCRKFCGSSRIKNLRALAPALLCTGQRRSNALVVDMLHKICFVRRVICFAVAGTAVLSATIPKAQAQGISFSGVSEGGAVVLGASAVTTNLSITATPSSPAGNTNIAFTLERQGVVFVNTTSPPPYSVTFSNLSAGKYFLSAKLVAAGSPPAGDVSFNVVPTSLQPVNDDWSHASVVPGLDVTVSGSNTYATAEVDEPMHADVGAGQSIWWTWTAPSSGVFTATTVGSSFDTALGVYTGVSISTLNEVVADDDIGPNAFSQVTFIATNGLVYYFAVDGASSAQTGQASLRITASPPPAIAITAPVNGISFLVGSTSQTTNAQAAASITAPSGIAQVNYWFDGPGTNSTGTLSSPYQFNIGSLKTGQYTLTLTAANNDGLIGVTNVGFSVISIAPQIVLAEFSRSAAQFQFGVLGFQGTNYDLEISSNLVAWSVATHWTNFSGAEIINNTNLSSARKQFYRAVLK